MCDELLDELHWFDDAVPKTKDNFLLPWTDVTRISIVEAMEVLSNGTHYPKFTGVASVLIDVWSWKKVMVEVCNINL